MLLLAVSGGVFAANKLVQKKVVESGVTNETEENTEENTMVQTEDNKSNNSSNNANNDATKSSNTEVEDSAYLEKYIGQQVKGEMPDGADGKKVVYLTFDDGPSTTVTPKILDILKEEGVHATFFVVGKNVEADKELVKEEYEQGNTVGIHSYTHDYDYLFPGGRINPQNCMSDFQKTQDAIQGVLGSDYKVRALRFPGGYYSWEKNDYANAQEVNKEMHANDWHQIDWNALSGDAEGGSKNAEQLYEEAVKTIGNREKAVILMHDTYGKEATAEALPDIIKYLKSHGYEFKTIQ
ncbi:MAG: polysaccharide deacetylase [Clostridium sp.]|nr:polysaccharide deacetylase [Romboutsia sp.]MCR4944983.1 polysaccharide deacetylase [Clostridium sp.]